MVLFLLKRGIRFKSKRDKYNYVYKRFSTETKTIRRIVTLMNVNVSWDVVEGLGAVAKELINSAGFVAALRNNSILLTTVEAVRAMRSDPRPLVAELLLMRHHRSIRLGPLYQHSVLTK